MLAPEQAKFWCYSWEYFEKYAVFDENDNVIGVKENAPNDFKVAYEEDKKMHDEALQQGIIL